VALLASAEGYTPRANQLIDAAREQIAPIGEIANALADSLPAPKAHPGRSRRRRRRKRAKQQQQAQTKQNGQQQEGTVEALPSSDGGQKQPEPARAAEG
jgi:hypothetical protein